MGAEYDVRATLRRGPDLTGPGSMPMCNDPVPLVVGVTFPAFPGESERTYVPRQNAVIGRTRTVIACRHCDQTFQNEGEAARHVAASLHVVTYIHAGEIVPVDTDDSWEMFEDGAGVSWVDRNP